MIDLDDIAVSVIVSALRHRDHARIGCVDRRALAGSDVDAQVSRPVIVPRKVVVVSQPGSRFGW